MKAAKTSKTLSPKQRNERPGLLKARFEKNLGRHPGLSWDRVQARREADPGKLWSLGEMERTDGKPDVVGHDRKTGGLIFIDCSAQNPEGRASLCYDREALDSRKEFKPRSNALDLAAAMDVKILTEEQYHELQKPGEFDTKSSRWVKAPANIRKLGGGLFGDRRYGRTFVHRNGAQSYYSGRGFHASLLV